MTHLSLAMIVKNEAANLPRCLASVRGLVNEMVVVDTGSSDDTVAIAESFGARVSHFSWIGDFAAARNESLRLCRGDWVLILDGDEAVDALDHETIRKACAQGKAPAYSLILRNYFLEGGSTFMDQALRPNESLYRLGAEYPFYADFLGLRLCRRYPDLAFEGRIHELLNPYFLRKKRAVGTLDAVIHHFGKVDLAREEEKKVRYLQMAVEEAKKHPLVHQCHYNLMIQAGVARDWELAITAGNTCLKLMAKPPLAVYTTLAIAYQGAGKVAESIPLLKKVLALQPGHPLALCRLPLSYGALGQSEEAIAAANRAVQAHPNLPAAWKTLFVILKSEDRLPEAREALLRGIQACPLDPVLRGELVRLELLTGTVAQAVADAWEALRVIPTCGGGDWHALVAENLIELGHAEQGDLVVKMGLKVFPSHRGLMRLSTVLSSPP